jgi:hypothetical protein
MLDFLNKFCCGGVRPSKAETIKTNLIETKESFNEIEGLKASIEQLTLKDKAYQNILSKLRDQLDGDKAGETINQLEDKIRQLNVENLRLQENSVNVDGLQLNYFLDKTNIFATGFKATFHNLVKTQQLLNPKTITYWENAEVLEEYKYIFRYIHQENINVHNESLSTMKGIMGDVIQGLLQNPEFIESASKASQGF